jgi:effector-binding domain-containing protein
MTTATDLEFTEVRVAPVVAVQMSGECAFDLATIGETMRQAFGKVMAFVTRHSLHLNGQPRAIYTSCDPKSVSFIVALPIAAHPSTPIDEPPVFVGPLPGLEAHQFSHRGTYPQLAQTYSRITGFLKEKGYMKSEADWARYMPMWEEYMNDPEQTPAAELLTHIFLPAKPIVKTSTES